MLRRGWDAWCVFWARARRNRNENENEPRQGGASTSKKLLAAIAILAVAFVVFAAIPAIADESDATDPSYEDGIIAAGYVADKVTAKGIIYALSAKNLEDVDDSTMFAVFQSKEVTGYTLKVNGTDVTSDASKSAELAAGVHVIYFKVAANAAAQDSVNEAWDAKKTYNVEITLGDGTVIEADITGQTVTLYQDVSESTGTIDIKGNVEIRLNGNDLTLTTPSNGVVFDVNENASLDIIGNDNGKNAEKDGFISMGYTAGNHSVISVGKNGSVKIDNVKFYTNGSALYPNGNASTVIVDKSEIKAGCYAVGTNYKKSMENDVGAIDITISGSHISATGYDGTAGKFAENGDACTVMINHKGAKLTITDSSINGTRQAVFVRAGTCTINNTQINYDDSFNGADKGRSGGWGGGNEVYAGAVVVGNCTVNDAYLGAAKLTMNGGFINADSGNAIVTTKASDANHSVDVSISTTITCGKDSAAASITVSNLKYTATNTDNPDEALLVSTGSVELSGVIDDVKIVEGEATVTGALTIADGGKLVLAKGATVTVKSAGSIKVKDSSAIAIDEGAKLVLEKKEGISAGSSTIYIPGSIVKVGSTEYVVTVDTFDETYTVYYGVATQPVAYNGKEIRESDIVGAVKCFDCIKVGGTTATLNATTALTDIEINDSVSGMVLEPGLYDEAVKFTTTISIMDGTESNSYITRTNAALLVTKAALSGVTAKIDPLTYTGSELSPEYVLTFNGSSVGDISVKYYSDKSCSTSVDVKNAGKYYAKFTAASDNKFFTGDLVVEFTVDKAAAGAFGLKDNKTDGDREFYWTANKYNGDKNLKVSLNDENGVYKVYLTSTVKSDGTPNYSAGVKFANQTDFDTAVKNVDSAATKAYTLYVKVEFITGVNSNYESETYTYDFEVGDVSRTIKTVVTPTAGGTAIAYIDGKEPGTDSLKEGIKGEMIALDMNHAAGYRFGSVEVIKTGTTEKVTLTDDKFEMPDADVTITVTFVQQYKVTYTNEKGSFVVKNGEADVKNGDHVDKDSFITLSVTAGNKFADAPKVTYNDGSEKSVKVNKVNDMQYTFKMPAFDVTISAEVAGNITVLLKEEGYADVELTGLADGQPIYLPFPADKNRWSLVIKGTAFYYDGGSAYVVDADAAVDGIIEFNAVDPDAKDLVEVQFVYEKKITSMTIDKGSVINTIPADSVKDGFNLKWFIEEGKEFDFSTPIDEDTTLFGEYDEVKTGEETVTVTFKYGENQQTIVEIKKGTAVGITPDAALEGKIYTWHVGDANGPEFVPTVEINENTTVVAVYNTASATKVTVWFVYGKNVETESFDKGAKLSVPTEIDKAAQIEGSDCVWTYNGKDISNQGITVESEMVIVAEYSATHVDVEYSKDLAVLIQFDEKGVFYTVIAKDGKAVPAGKLTVDYSYIEVDEIIGEYLATGEMTIDVPSNGTQYVSGYVDAPEGKELFSTWGTFSAVVDGQKVKAQASYFEGSA